MAEDNQPRNILEEIVWHKAIEVDRWRYATMLPPDDALCLRLSLRCRK